MTTPLQAAPTQAPASAAATNAEMARIDAQLELAAKKAALAGMQRAAAAGGADATPAIVGADAPPAARGGVHIVYEKDGKTIVLDNPTTEQLAQVGMAGPQPPDSRMIVSLTGATLTAIVVITWMVLNHLKGRRASVATRADPEMAARMTRIENAIESVAVEVERISEGQRFTSRMLSEGAAPHINHVPDHLVAVAKSEGVR